MSKFGIALEAIPNLLLFFREDKCQGPDMARLVHGCPFRAQIAHVLFAGVCLYLYLVVEVAVWDTQYEYSRKKSQSALQLQLPFLNL